MTSTNLKLAFAAAIGMFAVGAYAAGSTTTSIGVSATINNNCNIASVTAVSFTGYDPTSGSALNATGNIALKCTKNAAVSITMDQGAHPSGIAPNKQRNMSDGATPTPNTLAYNLFHPSALGSGASCTTTAWGDGTTAINVQGTPYAFTSPGVTGGNTVVNVCGTVPASQDVPAGTSYADTVNITVNF